MSRHIDDYAVCDFCGRSRREPDPIGEAGRVYCCDAAREDAESQTRARLWLTCTVCRSVVASLTPDHEGELIRGTIAAIPYLKLSRPFRIIGKGQDVYCVDCDYPGDAAGPVVFVGAEQQPS